VARFILLLTLAIVIARTLWRFFDAILRGAGVGTAAGGRAASRAGGGPPQSVKMSQCPVCGTYVVPGKAISAAHNGTTLFFDSEKCRAEYQSR
jgi:YHS domain-containing protein